MPKNSYHIPRVDFLRAVAILLVFVSHCSAMIFGWEGMGKMATEQAHGFYKLLGFTLFDGHRGVVLFFVISGLCIRLSHRAQSSFSAGHFYWRRFWRIYPPYLLSLLIFATIQHAALNDVLAHAFLVHNFSLEYFHSINPPFWSLAMEFQVYLLYPVLLWMHDRLGIKITAGILVILSVAGNFPFLAEGTAHADVQRMLLLVRQFPTTLWFTWYSGFLVADRLLDKKPIAVSRRCILLVSICLVPLVAHSPVRGPYEEPVNAIAMSLLVEEFLRCPLPGRFLAAWMSFWGLTGVSSYSFYLYFDRLLPFLLRAIAMTTHLTRSKAPRTLFAIGCPLSFLAIAGFSYVAYRVIELPSIAIGRSLFARFQQWQKARNPVAQAPGRSTPP